MIISRRQFFAAAAAAVLVPKPAEPVIYAFRSNALRITEGEMTERLLMTKEELAAAPSIWDKVDEICENIDRRTGLIDFSYAPNV